MAKLIRLILALVGIVVVVAFAIANRGPVTVSFYPTPFSIDLALFAVVLISLAVGVVLGGLATWLGAGHFRRRARKSRRRVRDLEADAAMRREEAARAEEARRREHRQDLALAAPAR